MTARFALPILILALAACGEPERKGGLSAEEERRLDNAARMLDEQMGNLAFGAPEEGAEAGDAPANASGNQQ